MQAHPFIRALGRLKIINLKYLIQVNLIVSEF